MSNKPKSSLPDDTDYIRKAVELARGWSLRGDTLTTPGGYFGKIDDQEVQDALAAQLVRQLLQAGHHWKCESGIDPVAAPMSVSIWTTDNRMYEHEGTYRDSMDYIIAIVDSGVLDTDREEQ